MVRFLTMMMAVSILFLCQASNASAGEQIEKGVTANYDFTLSARRHHYRHHRHHAGSCDGFHGCRCGVVAAQKHGLPLNYRGHNLKEANQWPATFSRASGPYIGGVVYQGVGANGHAHVSTIVGLTGDHCKVTVADDRGTYSRDICKRRGIVLAVNG